jgi:hypothetical protein
VTSMSSLAYLKSHAANLFRHPMLGPVRGVVPSYMVAVLAVTSILAMSCNDHLQFATAKTQRGGWAVICCALRSDFLLQR